MKTSLHIVCLDAPSPPDYGGAIDMHFKIKSLAAIGQKIVLHYFGYNPMRNAEGVENDCTEIHAYKRKPFYRALPLSRPFIVQSRINRKLIARLNRDEHPILLEGLHCAGIIPFINRPQRIVLRMHNEEASYYRHLAQTETSPLKRLYFKQESKLLNAYYGILDKNICLACLSETDMETFGSEYGFTNLSFIPCFLPWQGLNAKKGRGHYCLYHGNLAVSENEEAALWLIENVFGKVDVPLLIAGKSISKRLRNAAKDCRNISLVHNPSIQEIDDLVRNAHINVLPSMNATGVKLKLLNALLNGRHCLTNAAGVKGSKIESGLLVKENPEEWIDAIKRLMNQDFGAAQIEGRQEVLGIYDNKANATKLSALW